MDSGREQNYWPGFVDALSNVVLTLVFVLVIFVFALVMATNKVEQRVQEITQNSKTISESSAEKEQLQQQLATVTAELQRLQGTKNISEQDKTGAINQQAVAAQNQDQQIDIKEEIIDKANQGPVDVLRTKDSVVLNFPLAVVQMDQKSQDQLGHVIEATQKSVGKHKITMRSIIGRETYSVARRMAYYRAINARNYLITKMNETPDNITITIVTPTQPEDGHVEISFAKN